PGFLLSKQVAALAKANPAAQSLVLMHHGFITWAETPRAAYDIHIDLVTRAEEHLARAARGTKVFGPVKKAPLPAAKRREVAAALAPALRGAITAQQSGARLHRAILRFDDSDDVLAFVGSKEARAISQTGPATP